MGGALGYKLEGFDFIYLKERAYIPQGHVDLADEHMRIRKGLLAMIWEGRPLIVMNLPVPAKTEERTLKG